MRPASRIWLAIFLTLSFASARADDSRIYGVELEFENPEIANAVYSDSPSEPALYEASDENIKWRDLWAKLMKKRCKKSGDCKVKEIWDEFSWDGTWTYGVYEYEVKYTNGFAFRISIDPAVLEVKIGPYTKAEYQKYRALIDSEIYATAKELKLKVPKDAACHVTTGAKQAFRGDLRKYRNYLVNSANHPEAELVINTSIDNAPPISYLPEISRTSFAKVIAAADAGEFADEAELADQIVKKVQNRTYNPDFENEWDPAKKYQAKNNQNMTKKNPDKRRSENRAMPAAKSGDDVVALVELNDADLEYATKQRGRIEVDVPSADLTKREIVDRFEVWLKERGLSLKRYLPFFERAYAKAATVRKTACKSTFKPSTKKKSPKD